MGLLWIYTVRTQIVLTDFPHVKQPHIALHSSTACGHNGFIKASAWTDIQTCPELQCRCLWALVGFLDRSFTCSSFVSSHLQSILRGIPGLSPDLTHYVTLDCSDPIPLTTMPRGSGAVPPCPCCNCYQWLGSPSSMSYMGSCCFLANRRIK